jgi:hypothetical protein
MSTKPDGNKTQLVEIAKTVGAILGVPLALFAVTNSVIAQPIISLVVAIVAAIFISVWVILSGWANITQIITAWLALAVVVLAGFVIWPRTMTVEGHISDAAGKPVVNENVELRDVDNRTYNTETDADGYYQFTQVPTGRYRLQVNGTEVEGQTKGILVRVVQQNLAIPGALAEVTSTPAPILPTDIPTPTSVPPTDTPVPPADAPVPQPSIPPPITPDDSSAPPSALELLETARAWPVLVADTFDTDDGRWATGDLSTDGVARSRRIVDGTYRWSIEAAQDDYMMWTPLPDPLSDFYLTVETKLLSGPENEVRYGVIFRREGNDLYTFRIEDGPNFRVRLRYEDEWTDLIDCTRVSGIRPGEANRLTVIAEGSRFYFFIDDRYMGEVDDDRLSRGNVGLVVYANRNAGNEAIVEFDNFEVRSKP